NALLYYHYIISLLILSTHTPPPEIYTLSLHDALPISGRTRRRRAPRRGATANNWGPTGTASFSNSGTRPSRSTCCKGRPGTILRSEEHTSELQSLRHLVCRLLLEKKKKKKKRERNKK